jgi:hypothetical protein
LEKFSRPGLHPISDPSMYRGVKVEIDGTGLFFQPLKGVVVNQKAVSGTDFRNVIQCQGFIVNPHATYGKA